MNTYDAVLAALAAAPITPTPTEQLAAWARVSVSEARQALDLAIERGEVVAHPPGRPGQRWKWSWPEVKPAPAPSVDLTTLPYTLEGIRGRLDGAYVRVDALDKRTTKAMDYAGGARSAVKALGDLVDALDKRSHDQHDVIVALGERAEAAHSRLDYLEDRRGELLDGPHKVATMVDLDEAIAAPMTLIEQTLGGLVESVAKAVETKNSVERAVEALATRVGSLERGTHLAAIREEVRQVAVGLDAARGRSAAAYERAQEAHAVLGRLDPVVAATAKQGESLATESRKTTSRLAAAEDRLDQVGFDVEKVRRDADATAARLYADFCVAEDDRNTRARRAHDALHNDLRRTQEYVLLLVGAAGASASIAAGLSAVVAIATVWGWL